MRESMGVKGSLRCKECGEFFQIDYAFNTSIFILNMVLFWVCPKCRRANVTNIDIHEIRKNRVKK